ncbi:MAG: nucleotidyl transferase AbiEii/AbiGii toxin family protein [Lentisphaeria bacterium]|nr:nucleotidyl transferase AbiEii/AbiGii toxin family protein [Lentisphaeria bacterium]NQZ69175.1 nucleotidyl transferase AbiEii/AbiGii toxin family protein [Lentisphaeria bacterium]
MKRKYKELLLRQHPLSITILKHISRACENLQFPFILIGAQARDLILTGKFDISPGSTTLDIDFAVAVDSWEQYTTLKNKICQNGFEPVPGKQHKLIYKEGDYPIDLVPFGGIEEDGQIVWPPDRDVEMNVIGFQEVYANAESLEIDDELVIKVASLAGLAILKLIAWSDRHSTTTKDGEDFGLLLKHYADAGNCDRLYHAEDNNVMEQVDFNFDQASALLLGYDVVSIASAKTLQELRSIINNELNNDDELLIRTVMPCFTNNYDLTRTVLETFQKSLLH